jgi:small subunit ribosomal protein S1
MSTTSSLSPPMPAKDEDYWQALFQQEEAVLASSTYDTEETPPPSHLFLNGRAARPSAPISPEIDPWQMAEEAQNNDECLTLPIAGYNKGGLLVYWQGLQGFVPASQLIDFPQVQSNHDRINILKNWLDKELTLKIIEINRTNNRLIFSERATLVGAEERESLFDQLAPGDMVEGEVTNLTDFGVFVDIGGAEGLIHISELSWSRVTHPSQILKPKQTIRVKVLDVQADEGRIALSRKRLHRNPWQDVEMRYRPGQIVTGTVSNVVNFGAFIQLEEELEGLVHISELAEGTFLHPRNVVQKGEQVQAKVLHVSGSDKRLALSMRGIDSGHS